MSNYASLWLIQLISLFHLRPWKPNSAWLPEVFAFRELLLIKHQPIFLPPIVFRDLFVIFDPGPSLLRFLSEKCWNRLKGEQRIVEEESKTFAQFSDEFLQLNSISDPQFLY